MMLKIAFPYLGDGMQLSDLVLYSYYFMMLLLIIRCSVFDTMGDIDATLFDIFHQSCSFGGRYNVDFLFCTKRGEVYLSYFAAEVGHPLMCPINPDPNLWLTLCMELCVVADGELLFLDHRLVGGGRFWVLTWRRFCWRQLTAETPEEPDRDPDAINGL